MFSLHAITAIRYSKGRKAWQRFWVSFLHLQCLYWWCTQCAFKLLMNCYQIVKNGYTRNGIIMYFRLRKHDHLNLGNTWFKTTWPLQITCLTRVFRLQHSLNASSWMQAVWMQAVESKHMIHTIWLTWLIENEGFSIIPRLNIFLFNYFYLII